MIVLEINKFFQKVFGLQTFGGYAGHIIVPTLISFPLLLFLLSSFVNIIVNLNNDISEVWPSLMPSVGFFMYISHYWHILINRRCFNLLFNEMQAVVNESMC